MALGSTDGEGSTEGTTEGDGSSEGVALGEADSLGLGKSVGDTTGEGETGSEIGEETMSSANTPLLLMKEMASTPLTNIKAKAN